MTGMRGEYNEYFNTANQLIRDVTMVYTKMQRIEIICTNAQISCSLVDRDAAGNNPIEKVSCRH